MTAAANDFSIGVEEEYQIVDPVSRELRPRANRLLRRARQAVGDEVTNELYLSQIEIGTPVCRTLADVRAELIRLRRAVISAARENGSRIAAAGTHPFSHWGDQTLTPKPRYRDLAADLQQLVREQIICGCHVHIGIEDREAAVQVMNRARPWLSAILALSANSPFWLGEDTGYASYRTNLFGRFPMAGVPHEFASRAEFDELVASLTSAEVIEDGSFIYWDVRPSLHFETLEFRVTDVCLTVDEAVTIAGLTRALARTCHDRWSRDEPFEPVRPELLRAAAWRAARFGLEGSLIDVRARRSVPAAALVEALLEFLRPCLEELGEWDELESLVRQTQSRGNGARRQREALAKDGRMEDVVDLIVEETERGVV
jgi:glutamate---cysteine ligase / carboxylate-amine ligase